MTAGVGPAGPRWELGDRRPIAIYTPPLARFTVVFGLVLGVTLVWFLAWLGWPWAAWTVLTAIVLAIGACCYLPLDHLAVGDSWVANGPPERPRLVEAADVRSIGMPDLVSLGAPVVKLHTATRTARIDVNALVKRVDLIRPVLAVVAQALVAGAEIDHDAAATLESLRIRAGAG